MGDLLSDLGDAFSKVGQSGLLTSVSQLLNPKGTLAGQSTLATNGGTQTVGGIPITAGLDANTKMILIIFIIALIALIGFAIFK